MQITTAIKGRRSCSHPTSNLRLWLCGALCLAALLTLGLPARAESEHGGGHGAEATEHGEAAHGEAAHGEAAHGEAAHGEATHGGGHHGPAKIENWFSLSYGEGKQYQNGPFAFMVMNFVILLFVLVKFAKKPFVGYLENRHNSIRQNLAEAQKLREEAEQKLEEIKNKLKNLDNEISEIKDGVRKDAEQEKERIIADAKSQAEGLLKAADRSLEEELRRARRRLEAEAVSAAMEAAEKLIRQKINDGDRKRINEDYYQQIASSGGTN